MQLLASPDVNWWTGDYCDVFISCFDSFWRHPFNAEHPLLRHWYISTNLLPWRNQFLANFNFWMNSFFNLEWRYMQLCNSLRTEKSRTLKALHFSSLSSFSTATCRASLSSVDIAWALCWSIFSSIWAMHLKHNKSIKKKKLYDVAYACK